MVCVPSNAHCGQYGGFGSLEYVICMVDVHAFMSDAGPGRAGGLVGLAGETRVRVGSTSSEGTMGPPGLNGSRLGPGWSGTIGPPGLYESGVGVASSDPEAGIIGPSGL